MFVMVRQELFVTKCLAINLNHIVTAREVILRDWADDKMRKKKDCTGVHITMSDGMTYNIVEGLDMKDLA